MEFAKDHGYQCSPSPTPFPRLNQAQNSLQIEELVSPSEPDTSEIVVVSAEDIGAEAVQKRRRARRDAYDAANAIREADRVFKKQAAMKKAEEAKLVAQGRLASRIEEWWIARRPSPQSQIIYSVLLKVIQDTGLEHMTQIPFIQETDLTKHDVSKIQARQFANTCVKSVHDPKDEISIVSEPVTSEFEAESPEFSPA
jgi:hypothetical protein